MRVLVAISILAFLALLWASIAIFQHIRRAHRRRRRILESTANNLSTALPDRFVIAPPPTTQVVSEITFTDPEAPLPEVAFTAPEAPIAKPIPPSAQPYLRQSEVQQAAPQQIEPQPEIRLPILQPVEHIPFAAPGPEQEIPPLGNEFFDTLPPPPSPAPPDPALSPVPAWPHFGFTPARPIISKEPIPYAAPPSDSSVSIAAARSPIEFQQPAPAVKPLYQRPNFPASESSASQPAFSLHRPSDQPMPRSDWAYFNKDMGDLSDPAPAGSRPKIRIANSGNSNNSE